MCQWEQAGNHGRAIEIPYPQPPRARTTGGVDNSLFHISVKRVEIDENVNIARMRTHWLALK